jgi:uncharacterized membrane protein
MDREHKTVAWIVVGVVALCLAVSVVTLVWTQNSGDDGAPTPGELPGRSQGVHVGVVVLELGLSAAFVGLAAYALVRLVRQRAPKRLRGWVHRSCGNQSLGEARPAQTAALFIGAYAYRRTPWFEDLDPAEQRRREEAARLLHDL